jgi:nucleoside-diphosphate-sugar epimerase
MRVLLTGARGFIGAPLLERMVAERAEIHAVSSSRGADGGPVAWHTADLREPAAAAGLIDRVRPELVIHCAWCTEHGRYWSSPDNLEWLRGTIAMARRLKETGHGRFVGVGSCAEYATGAAATVYGAAKASAFALLSAVFVDAPERLAWARVFFPYGPGEKPSRLIPSLIQGLGSGRPVPLTHGRQVRDFMHRDDVAEAIWLVAKRGLAGAVDIGTGRGTTVREVAEEIGAALGGADLLRFGSIAVSAAEPASLVADAGRLSAEAGFAPRLALREGLAATIAWWRSAGAASADGSRAERSKGHP